MLRQKRHPDSIVSAREAMVQFGAAATGAHYPTGTERVDNIDKCAAEE
jgi:hypothetical protein